ncbi:ABC transporter substrate-binding protein [Mycetocola zhujimingii]|uniref:Sugar ABC transporter substrate-binding protein n=1 Tax=Mycetocola zhujimingii TaxID=2079792 RepID=A0A2U1TFJ5_9MICO|nr:extracellular solute-binding protein [Mycetocola zhujimingii]AWB85610.1 sugar ABC transporter substrate-binding protein [Mycetocola zhujimingii]PWC07659.1 sugar ABC transporter substrate-binding protein [Mycetocola zhujimingii]
MKTTPRAVAVALLTTTAIALTGCSASSESGGSADAAECTPADGAVDLTFTSWIPGIEEVVDIWNAENPDIQVKVQTGPNGNGGTYQNFFNQLEAGNAPDLGQIEYDALPNFRVQNGLMNLADCEEVVAAEDSFVDWTWGQVTFGEEDSVYAVPQDSGPMALFYRSDLFEANGIAIPTTWAEYEAAAIKIRELGGYITNFSQGDINQFAGFVWQAGGSWFENDGTDWTVDLTDETTTTVADYWQGLIDRDLVSSYPAWTSEWDNAYNSSEVWTWNSAVWGANSIASGAPDTAGKWSVAPSPQWNAGEEASGNWGGSSTAVFTGSEHPYEAAKFALWLNTSEEALTAMNKSANIYPATKEGLNLPVLKEGVEFYGGQAIYDVFAEASAQVSPDFAWGPTMTQTYNDVSDGFKAAVSGNGTLKEALESGEKATIDALKSQSIPVKE